MFYIKFVITTPKDQTKIRGSLKMSLNKLISILIQKRLLARLLRLFPTKKKNQKKITWKKTMTMTWTTRILVKMMI